MFYNHINSILTDQYVQYNLISTQKQKQYLKFTIQTDTGIQKKTNVSPALGAQAEQLPDASTVYLRKEEKPATKGGRCGSPTRGCSRGGSCHGAPKR